MVNEDEILSCEIRACCVAPLRDPEDASGLGPVEQLGLAEEQDRRTEEPTGVVLRLLDAEFARDDQQVRMPLLPAPLLQPVGLPPPALHPDQPRPRLPHRPTHAAVETHPIEDDEPRSVQREHGPEVVPQDEVPAPDSTLSG